jgi:hypothetical protein
LTDSVATARFVHAARDFAGSSAWNSLSELPVLSARLGAATERFVRYFQIDGRSMKNIRVIRGYLLTLFVLACTTVRHQFAHAAPLLISKPTATTGVAGADSSLQKSSLTSSSHPEVDPYVVSCFCLSCNCSCNCSCSCSCSCSTC